MSKTKNEKAPSAANARGQKISTSKRYYFSELDAITQGGKRVTMAIAADLRDYPPPVLRRLTTNRDALQAIDLAEVMKARYLVFGGRLMNESAGAIAIQIPSNHAAHALLPLAVETVKNRLAELSDVTMWTPLVDGTDRERLKPIIGAGGAAA
jgi:hypothetical protein